ncbi:selenium-binding protein [Klebsormidium nitens]|uniref:Methanethiol oxidase n=1 Tax=Klebsormidium nitens TaxID=105231 RepID=A0A1Y1HL83_KLENI|nr:selenium-binding protein [Klebsormidium nitens]|eukprot:GAQ79370.1 selenium-binding protein [Klebsormidium nitens]
MACCAPAANGSQPNGASEQHTEVVARGPGYATPLDAFNSGEVEKLLYVVAVYTGTAIKKPDYLATIDVDPASPTYSQIIHRAPVPFVGDELHHTGWNACSSCHNLPGVQRKYLVAAGVLSSRIYAFDVLTDPRAPTVAKIVEPEEIQRFGLAFPHTSHCLATGDVMISFMGDVEGNSKGSGFLLLDSNFKPKGRWEATDKDSPPFGYDFWYQPRHNVLISSSWGAPKAFTKGFNPAHVGEGLYGQELYVYDWTHRTLKQKLDLGGTGLIPLEIRFLHEPNRSEGYVASALSSTLVRFFKKEDDTWDTQVAVTVPPKTVEGWALPHMPGLITDYVISLDDKYVYFSNWLHGDIRQYDISDTANPKLVGQVFVGGSIAKGGPVKVVGEEQPTVPTVKGHTLRGGPQMIQLSLDGSRLYVTNSLFSSWDNQFYPDLVSGGSHILKINVDKEKGGLTIDPDFFVDFGTEPEGPALAHEVRYPGGDCTSDIWT